MIRCVTGYIIQAMQKSRFSFENEQNFPIHTQKKIDMYTTRYIIFHSQSVTSLKNDTPKLYLCIPNMIF